MGRSLRTPARSEGSSRVAPPRGRSRGGVGVLALVIGVALVAPVAWAYAVREPGRPFAGPRSTGGEMPAGASVRGVESSGPILPAGVGASAGGLPARCPSALDGGLACPAEAAPLPPTGPTSVAANASQAAFLDAPSWVKLTAPAPLRDRYGEAMTYDPALPGLLVFGGTNSTTYGPENDTWIFVDGQWSQIDWDHGPPLGSSGATASYDPDLRAVIMVLSPTYGGGSSLQTWSFANRTWSHLTESTAPSARTGEQMAYDVADRELVLFGGSLLTGGVVNDTWALTNGQWSSINAAHPPPARTAGLLFPDPTTGDAILFGGASGTGAGFNDTWRFVDGAWSQLTTSVAPSGRSYPIADFDGQVGAEMLYGGYVGSAPTSDLWGFDNGTWTQWAATSSPGVRGFGGGAFDAADPGLFLLGGLNVAGPSNDLWVWSAPNASLTTSPGSLDLGQRWYANASSTVVSGAMNVTWQVVGGAAGCSSNSSPTMSCRPTVAGAYRAYLNITGANGSAARASAVFRVDSDPTVGAPTAVPSASETGGSVTFRVTATGGTGVYVAYGWIGLSSGACSGLNGSIVQCTFASPGALTLQATVTDTNGMTSVPSGPLHYLVIASPTISTPTSTPSAADVGTVVQLTAIAAAGTGAYTAYTWTNLSFGSCSGNATDTVRCTTLYPGDYAVSVTVTDSNGVTSPPSPAYPLQVYPALKLIALNVSPVAVDLGDAAQVTLQYTGGSPNASVSWPSLPPGCLPGPSGGFSCAPASPGSYPLQATVSDPFGAGFTTPTVLLVVNPRLDVQYWVADPPNGSVGQPLTLSLLVRGGTAPLQYAYRGLPPGCAPADAAVLSCRPTATGTYLVDVSISDASGAAITRTLPLNVTAGSPAAPGGSPGIPVGYLAGAGAAAAAAALGLIAVRRRRSSRAAPSGEEEPGGEADAPVEGPSTNP